MFATGTFGSATFAQAPDFAEFRGLVSSLVVSSLIIPEGKTSEGVLIKSTAAVWHEIAKLLGKDWSKAYEIPPERWEELVAGAFKRDGYDDVILTPRSGDRGRDVIATKNGFGSVRILGSVKAYKPDHLVSYDDVRALMGVVAMDPKASKGIITTTSGFPPKIDEDPLIASVRPTRLELVSGVELEAWIKRVSENK